VALNGANLEPDMTTNIFLTNLVGNKLDLHEVHYDVMQIIYF
jgi:hypothetical protein